MENKVTPGPWWVEPCSNAGLVLRRSDDRNHPQTHLQIVPEADAHLIAAAPDLLAALERISQHAYDDDTPINDVLADFDAMREIARAALAKARGEL